MGYDVMFIVELLVVVILIAMSFFAGVWLANCFNKQALAEQKEALEKQYLRLRAKADADDPCRPYKFSQPPQYTTEPQPIFDKQFEDTLKSQGKAIQKINRSR